jgi:hypothetical protein
MNSLKFTNFLDSLKSINPTLIESIKSGFSSLFEGIQKISLQQAQDVGMFGPVYHGTTQENLTKIEEEGFRVIEGEARQGDIRHGLMPGGMGGVNPPIHFLGFGIYLTTVKSIAKKFANDSAKGMKTYFVNSKNIETINYGSQNTIMKWWIANGFDPELAKTDRVAATKKMTEQLVSKYDAVWYKGQGLYKLLDGDQICVYKPELIVEVDASMTQPGDVGSKVKRKADGMIGIIKGKQSVEGVLERYPGASTWLKPYTKYKMEVTWKKGGTDSNVQDVDVEFV